MTLIQTHSPMYENDVVLCRLMEHSETLMKLYESNANLSTYSPGAEVWACLTEKPKPPTNEDVYSIVCRCQGLRVLQDLYLDDAVANEYRDFGFGQTCVEKGNSETLAKTTVRISQLPVQTSGCGGRNFDSKQHQRFYKALVEYWCVLESHWLYMRSSGDTHEGLQKLERKIGLLSTGWNGPRDLRRTVEMLEVFRFVYGFLLWVVFPNHETAKPFFGHLDDYEGCTTAFDWHEWSWYVQCCRYSLRPPDVVELLAARCSAPNSA